MPEAIREAHSVTIEAAEDDWLAYNQVPEIREMVDLYFEKLPAYLPEEQPAFTYTKKKIVPTRDRGLTVDTSSQDSGKAYTDARYAIEGTKTFDELEKLALSLFSRIKAGEFTKQQSDTIKGWISLHEQDLAIGKKVAGGKKAKTATAKKKTSAAKVKKEKPVKHVTPVSYQEHFTEEEQVIKTFIGFNGKTKTFKQVKALYDRLNKYIVERKIRKSSPNADAINLVQDRLETVLDSMGEENIKKIEIDLSNKTLALLHKFVKQSKVAPTVQLLKRFIPMMDIKPDVAKAKKLLQDMERAEEKETVHKFDTYYGLFKNAKQSLKAYLSNGNQIMASTPGLSGLGSLPEFSGLGCPGNDDQSCGCTKTTLAGVKKKALPKEKELKLPKTLQGLFTPIDKPGVDTSKNTFRLKGDLGLFLGKIERKEFAIALRGDKGAGKTRLLYQLKDIFAEMGFNVASFTLEIDKGSDLVKRMSEAYIKPKNRRLVQAASISPSGIDTIREAAKHFDVVAIDSWSKLNVKQEEFDRLRKDFPNTFFLIIFQSTSAGTARGGSMAEYDAGIVIQVDLPGIAYCEKNRYADSESMGKKYDVFNQKLITNE